MRRSFIYTVVSILLFWIFPNALSAQDDSLSVFFPASFVPDHLTDSELLPPGTLKIKKSSDPELDFARLSFSLFPQFEKQELAAYRFLQNLAPTQQSYLMTSFQKYKPVFEKELKLAGLPPELKYLPVALSYMNPTAVGANREAGVWQLTHFQALLNGIKADRLVDERFLAGPATQAALKQIAKNRELFGDCERAVLGFLVGNTRIRNALSEMGNDCKTIELVEKLPLKYRHVLAMWKAVALFLHENELLYPDEILPPDTVWVRQEMHLKQIAWVLNIPENDLDLLNPQFRFSIVPRTENKTALLLPAGKKDDFLMMQDAIFAAYDSTLFDVVAPKIEYPPAPNRSWVGEKVKDLEIEGKTKIRYILQPGDVLGVIAEEYDVRVADLKYWNNIYNERKIQAGQQLDIFVDDDKAEYYRSLQKQPEKLSGSDLATKSAPAMEYEIPASAKKIEHIVRSGESPYVIAKKYDGVSPEAILFWNGISDARKIQIGQKLTIYLTQ